MSINKLVREASFLKKIILGCVAFTVAFAVTVPFGSNQALASRWYPATSCDPNKPGDDKTPITQSSMLTKETIEKLADKKVPSTGSAGFDAIIVGIALAMTKANFWTSLAVSAVAGFSQDLASRKAEYYEGVLKRIAKGEIKGLRVTITQNTKSSYPAAFVKYEEVK
ncbi:hypothetical protein [Paenibacillus apiarius]|uniref:hypothetical protein n=1 Tax=Paenibacillus apiarius TaxID=46240 RepID=UPI001981DD9F|nr:hypothetical protein [Paenibacillus apiarius]MBN3524549.1 hypothetical protein [Paenibacillus apiarius]